MTAAPAIPAPWAPDPFWRIEQNPLHPFAYELVDGRYELAGEAGVEDELVLSAPFEIRLPIRDLAP